MTRSRIESQVDLDLNQSHQFDSTNSIISEEKLGEIDELFKNFLEHSQTDIVLYRHEYNMTTIYNSLKLVLSRESHLLSQVNKLKSEHEELGLKYNQAIKLKEIDKTTRNDLLEQLDKAWDQASIAQSKEKRALETLNSLKLEVSSLSKLVEQVVGLTFGQEYNLRELTKEKEILQLDNKFLNSELEDLKQRIKDLKQKETEQEKVVDDANVRVANAEQELLVNTIQNQQSLRRIEKLEDEIFNIKKLYDLKDNNLNQLSQMLNQVKVDLSKQEQISKEYQQMIEKSKKENDILSNRVVKIQHEMELLFNKNDSLQTENNQLVIKLKHQDELNDNLKQEINQITKLKEGNERKIVQLDQEKLDLAKEKHELETRVDILNKQTEKLIRELEQLTKKIQQQTSEKDQLNLDIFKLKSKIDHLENDLNSAKHNIKTYQNENQILKKEIVKLESNQVVFDKERYNYSKYRNDYLIRIEKLNHFLKLKTNEITELNKKIKENETKLSKLSRLHETTRIERNNLTKINNENKEQITQLKEINEDLKFNLTNQTDMLKQNKYDFDRMCYENTKVEKNLNKTRELLDLNATSVDELKQKIFDFETSELRLLQIINELNKKIEVKNKAFEKIQIERNIFGTQLVRRNDEISLLYEKIKLIENLNQRGENAIKILSVQYKQTHTRLQTLTKEKMLKQNENETLKKYKQELAVVNEQILLERAKRDVAEKKANYNIHRWRRLRGSDPTKYELITKVNFLQKKLIQKCLQISSLQLKFEEKDRLFMELTKSLARRLVVQENKSEYQHEIEARNKQIKVNVMIKFRIFKLLFL